MLNIPIPWSGGSLLRVFVASLQPKTSWSQKDDDRQLKKHSSFLIAYNRRPCLSRNNWFRGQGSFATQSTSHHLVMIVFGRNRYIASKKALELALIVLEISWSAVTVVPVPIPSWQHMDSWLVVTVRSNVVTVNNTDGVSIDILSQDSSHHQDIICLNDIFSLGNPQNLRGCHWIPGGPEGCRSKPIPDPPWRTAWCWLQVFTGPFVVEQYLEPLGVMWSSRKSRTQIL